MLQRSPVLNLKAFSDIYYSNLVKKIPALFSSLLEVGKLSLNENKQRPQGHTVAEQVKNRNIDFRATAHRHSGKKELRTINIRGA